MIQAEDDQPLCGRCKYDEGDADEAIPRRFIWLDIVCPPCARELRRLDEALTDREEMSW